MEDARCNIDGWCIFFFYDCTIYWITDTKRTDGCMHARFFFCAGWGILKKGKL